MIGVEMDAVEQAKLNAALTALTYVTDGMTLGLGTGSTAEIFIELLGARISETDLRVRGVATSRRTADAAEAAGIEIVDVERVDRIHLGVDGADEVDPEFALVKGGGGALLREKVIANASDEFVVMVHGPKMVDRLGAFPLPVEVDRFGFTITAKKIHDVLKSLRYDKPAVELRTAPGGQVGRAFVTDGGNYILDCHLGAIHDVDALAHGLKTVPGVVDHGLFVGMTNTVIVGYADRADVLER